MNKISRRGFLGRLLGAAAVAVAASLPFVGGCKPTKEDRELAKLPIGIGGPPGEVVTWKVGVVGYERLGFAVIDDNALKLIEF